MLTLSHIWLPLILTESSGISVECLTVWACVRRDHDVTRWNAAEFAAMAEKTCLPNLSIFMRSDRFHRNDGFNQPLGLRSLSGGHVDITHPLVGYFRPAPVALCHVPRFGGVFPIYQKMAGRTLLVTGSLPTTHLPTQPFLYDLRIPIGHCHRPSSLCHQRVLSRLSLLEAASPA